MRDEGMANIKSQMKRNRQNERLRVANKAKRSELKTRAKQAIVASESGDEAATEAAFREAQKRIDMAAAKGLIHKNTAARKKARLAKRLSK
jgi:small subunit ribosomal protein S20